AHERPWGRQCGPGRRPPSGGRTTRATFRSPPGLRAPPEGRSLARTGRASDAAPTVGAGPDIPWGRPGTAEVAPLEARTWGFPLLSPGSQGWPAGIVLPAAGASSHFGHGGSDSVPPVRKDCGR